MSERIRLIFRSVSEIVGTKDIGLLVLTDSNEQRQVALPCDKLVLHEFGVRMNKTPFLEKLLPEVLWKAIRWQSVLRFEVHLDSLVEGKYQAVLSNIDTLDDIPISAAEGVLLSFVSHGDVPVLMDQQLFMRQSTVYDSESIGISLPVNTISDEMLQSALDKAVQNENYEMASHLRDEINRRKRLAEEADGDIMPEAAENLS
ncbi:MAG: UvrB/UvrC motif-containing protein [Prevotella sp.]|nr:UvrB/UvrC motif-containing protein [Prevotella sp.]